MSATTRCGALATAALALATLIGCGPGEPVRLGMSLPALRAPCELDKLEATLRFPGQDKSCKLERKQQENVFRGSCPGVAVEGDKLRVLLEYTVPEFPAVVLAKIDKVVTLQVADGRATLKLVEADVDTDLDDDSDGMTNIKEICVGRDPTIADSASFSEIVGESGAPGAARAIGEKVRIIGSAIPKAELLTIKIGPFLGKPKAELQPITPTNVEPTAIELVIPPGVDTSDGKLTVEVEAQGQKTTLNMPVVRLWAAASRGKGQVVINSSNSYAPPGLNSADYTVISLDAPCGILCDMRLRDSSADGRLLIAQTLAGNLFVVDWVQRKPWSASIKAWHVGAAIYGDYLVSIAANGKAIESRFLNRKDQRIDGVVDSVTVPTVTQLVRGRAGSNRFYLLTISGGAETISSYSVDQATGKLTDNKRSLILGGSCPFLCTYSIVEVEADKLVVGRRQLNLVTLEDLVAGPGATKPITIPSPWAITMTYGTFPKAYVTADTSDLNKKLRLCPIDVATFGNAALSCIDMGTKDSPVWSSTSTEGDTVFVSVSGKGEIYPFDVASQSFGTAHTVDEKPGDVLTQP